MAEDIKRFTENCKACLKDAPEQCNETLRQHTIPGIQGSKIGLDIFTYKDAHYLVLVDYLTDFIDFEKLLNLSSESVIDICKRSFIRCDDVCATIMPEKAHKRANIQRSYNKSATDLPAVAEGTSVLLRDFVSHKQKWKDAKVVKRLSERSYVLDVDGETVRRNRQYFRPISEDFQSDKQNASTSEDQHGSMNRELNCIRLYCYISYAELY
ncbi:hypothetical protein LSAT2_001249 [Lamellibrachia satsuma]|nr:hypothetical protein LSAT2_001249 [Lamellibrachia satsuma]